MKFKSRTLVLPTTFFILLQTTSVSATIDIDSNCCQKTTTDVTNPIAVTPNENLSSTTPKQIQILFNNSESQMAAKERRILLPLLAAGALTLLAFVRV